MVKKVKCERLNELTGEVIDTVEFHPLQAKKILALYKNRFRVVQEAEKPKAKRKKKEDGEE